MISLNFNLDELLIPNLTIGSLSFYVILLVILLCGYWYGNRQHGLPPGPLGLPIVGYLPFIGERQYEHFRDMGIKYGNIFSFYLKNKLCVVLNDYDVINEAFVQNAEIFSGRPNLDGADLSVKKFHSISTSDGAHFKEQRRFALHSLRDLGLGKTSIEPNVLSEICEFCDELHKYSGQSQDITKVLGPSIVNNICLMVFGKRFDYHDEFLRDREFASDQFTTLTNFFAYSTFFPWIMKIPIINVLLDKRVILRDILIDGNVVATKIIADYKKAPSEAHCENYINMYLKEMCRQDELPGNEGHVFTVEALAQNIFLLFGAGLETIKTTLSWCVVYMLKFPEIQRKLQQEIDVNIGKERLPSWSDRQRTPYVEATILETLRMASIIPLNLVHRNLKDVKVRGYNIPKDSYIISNLWNVHHDPKLWKDPEQFKPERFLSESGEVVKSDYLIPFSLGKRQCLGESLARVELYLYFTTILQRFTLSLPADARDYPSLVPDVKVNFSCKPYAFKVCCIPRQ